MVVVVGVVEGSVVLVASVVVVVVVEISVEDGAVSAIVCEIVSRCGAWQKLLLVTLFLGLLAGFTLLTRFQHLY